MLTFEISRKPNPVVTVSYDPEWNCPRCGRHYRLDQEGDDQARCVMCMMPPNGKLRLYGWLIERTDSQLTVCHL